MSDKPVRLDSTLSKGLQILEALSQSSQGKGVTELARELDLTKSNTFRLLQTLVNLGFARHLPGKNYAPTLKTWQIGRRVVDNLNLRELAADAMRRLSDETFEAVYLAVPEHLHVIYIDKIESRQPIRSWNPIGGHAPIHCVGTGKAILAANYQAMRGALAGHLTKHTERTLTRIEDLDADVEATRKRGFAIDKGEFREKVFSMGAAIHLPKGEAIGALGISAPEVNLGENAGEHYGELVAKAARQVSEKLATTD